MGKTKYSRQREQHEKTQEVLAGVGVRTYIEAMYWDNFSMDGEQNMEMQMSQTGQEPRCVKALQTLLSFKFILL